MDEGDRVIELEREGNDGHASYRSSVFRRKSNHRVPQDEPSWLILAVLLAARVAGTNAHKQASCGVISKNLRLSMEPCPPAPSAARLCNTFFAFLFAVLVAWTG